jgi:hypothetical protein
MQYVTHDRQALVGESQCRFLGFRATVGIYKHTRKYTMTHYWVLLGPEHLNIGYKVAMSLEVFIMVWILSELPRHKVRQSKQQLSIIKCKLIILRINLSRNRGHKLSHGHILPESMASARIMSMLPVAIH